MKKHLLFISITLFLLMSACGNAAQTEQVKYNTTDSDVIHIGVAYPAIRNADTYFYKGLELAVDIINKSGGVLGKPIEMYIRDDNNDTNQAMQIAQTFYQRGIPAVIGHWSTNVCYFVEDVYERNGVVMLTPDATGMNIFESRYNYIFRMNANNQNFSEAIASFMDDREYKRVAIYFSDDEYGLNFAEIMEDELVKKRIKVVDRVTSITSANVDAVMQRWKAFGCDALFMAATFPEYREPIRLIRDIDGQIPIFGADNFERTTFRESLEIDPDGIYIASFHMEDLDSDFLADFRTRYGHDPDIHAISGYECVYLLKDAIDAAGTLDGTAIAEYLSALENYKTVSGIRSYNSDTQEFDGYKVYVRELVP